MEKIFKLSQEYIDCLDEIEYSREHLFITGKAGTGKSTLLDLFRRTTSKNVVILAPTGIAALKVHGQTIHSFFKFPPRLILPSDIKYTPSLKRIVNKLEILILDEISMVRADILDGINKILQLHRNNNKPFGGIRLVAFGDIYQLPPIVSSVEEKHFFQNNYTSAYFFASEIWQQLHNMRYINLSMVYRQTDRSFIRLLDEIRMGDIDYDSLTALNENVDPDFDQEGYIYLSPRNATMQRINQQKLAELPNEERTYLPTITGEYNPNNMPTDPVLRIKVGAQVIFVKNDPDKEYVNGSLGIVTDLDTNLIRIRLNHDDKEVTIGRATWDMIRYRLDPDADAQIKPEVVGTLEAFPVKLAWAMSIHKSQGQTFEKVILDMEGGAFEFGQTYVALSRCTTLEGIVLKKPLRQRDIMVDQRVVDFYINHFR
ncbi:MAG: AAA family ATPase [Saprospiraceae bacterium]|jgi:ATP-dependent DNA helicase PIF1|nr:AAA family ATPase [Saprospiraceae bacterium]HQU94721.1 DEAD/DEAH box helicase [Saprospiraceae bacterium]